MTDTSQTRPDGVTTSQTARSEERYPGTPGWVKLFGIALLVLVLVVIGAHLLMGGMGPGSHMAPGGH